MGAAISGSLSGGGKGAVLQKNEQGEADADKAGRIESESTRLYQLSSHFLLALWLLCDVSWCSASVLHRSYFPSASGADLILTCIFTGCFM